MKTVQKANSKKNNIFNQFSKSIISKKQQKTVKGGENIIIEDVINQ